MSSTRVTLLERVRDQRDEGAWQQFFELYAPLLYRYARSRGLGHDDAQEVRDRCLATLTRRLQAFRYDQTRGRFKTWLYRVVRDAVIDLVRQQRRRPPGEPLDSDGWGALPDGGDGPDALWERAWLHEHLLHAFERLRPSLTPRHDQVFRMLLLQGASIAEVCAALDLRPAQVHKARAHVLARLRKEVGRLGLVGGDRLSW